MADAVEAVAGTVEVSEALARTMFTASLSGRTTDASSRCAAADRRLASLFERLARPAAARSRRLARRSRASRPCSSVMAVSLHAQHAALHHSASRKAN